jgi:hypothetical protein
MGCRGGAEFEEVAGSAEGWSWLACGVQKCEMCKHEREALLSETRQSGLRSCSDDAG